MAPERVTGVVGMSVPFLPRAPEPTVALMRKIYSGGFFYIIYFQDPGVADAELNGDPARTMRRMLAGLKPGEFSGDELSALVVADDAGFIDRLPEPKGLPDWLSQDELDFYVAEFTRTGFTGGLNWYRNMDRNWHLSEHLAEEPDRPAVRPRDQRFIAGSADPVLTFAPPDAGEAYLDDYRGRVLIDGAGHWIQQERPGEVNAALLSFLEDTEDTAERKASK